MDNKKTVNLPTSLQSQRNEREGFESSADQGTGANQSGWIWPVVQSGAKRSREASTTTTTTSNSNAPSAEAQGAMAAEPADKKRKAELPLNSRLTSPPSSNEPRIPERPPVQQQQQPASTMGPKPEEPTVKQGSSLLEASNNQEGATPVATVKSLVSPNNPAVTPAKSGEMNTPRLPAGGRPPYHPQFMGYPPHPAYFQHTMQYNAQQQQQSTPGPQGQPPPSAAGQQEQPKQQNQDTPSQKKDKRAQQQSGTAPPLRQGMFPPGMFRPMFPMQMMTANPYMAQNNNITATPYMAPKNAGICLAMSCDEEQLSEYQMLIRKQLEVFEASAEDVESNTQGRKKSILEKQVGLRCKHCAGFPLRQRGKGAVYYPAKLTGVYQAAQNMASTHLCESCQCIPPGLKAKLRELRVRRESASGGKRYWADGARAMGLYEADSCLRLRRDDNSNV